MGNEVIIYKTKTPKLQSFLIDEKLCIGVEDNMLSCQEVQQTRDYLRNEGEELGYKGTE